MVDLVIDAKGRRIELRHIGVLEELRLFKALGPELSENRAYFGLAKIAAAVKSIDDMPVPFPNGEVAIEGILGRIGDAGADAVGQVLRPISLEEIASEAGN